MVSIKIFYAMFENSYLQISAENVTRKKVFLIFLFQKKVDLLPLSKACCFEIFQVSSHPRFDVQSNSSPTLCSKLHIISMGLPHHALNRPTPATFQTTSLLHVTNGPKKESSLHIVL